MLLYRCVVLRKVSVLVSGQLGLRNDFFAELAELLQYAGDAALLNGFVFGESCCDCCIEAGIQSFPPSHKLVLHHSRIHKQVQPSNILHALLLRHHSQYLHKTMPILLAPLLVLPLAYLTA